MLTVRNHIRAFFNSFLFPIYVAFFVLTGHIYSRENFAILMIIAATSLAFLICDDLKFFISPLLSFYFVFSKKTLFGKELTSESSIRFYAICIGVLILSIIVHFIIYRKSVKIREFTSSRLFIGLLILSVFFVLNGAIGYEEYTKSSLVFGLLITISIVLPFFMLSINLELDKRAKDVVIFTLLLISIVICAELLNLYLGDIKIINGRIQKTSIDLGWGVSNNIGAIIAMLIPIHFYCASKTRLGFIFIGTAVMSYIFTVMSLSRTAILFATVIFLACLIFIFIYKNKYSWPNRIYSVLFIIAVAAIYHYNKDVIDKALDEIIRIGLDDNGRLEYFKDGITKFKEYPIFGVGFGSSHGTNDRFVISAPEYFHNTIIQILASCGILGFLAYCYHRIETFILFIKYRSNFTFYMAMCITALLLTSLLDIHLFNIFPALFYSVILCIIEKNGKSIKSKEKMAI